MKNLFLSGAIILFSTYLFGQVGVSGAFRNFNAEEWRLAINEFSNEEFSTPTGFGIGIDYWFRIKNRRIEFLPELNYVSTSSTNVGNSLEHNQLGFHFNTNIYLFDLEGDCDCPTWSKSGNIFQKGFFVQISPGLANVSTKIKDENNTVADDLFFWEIGVGAGVDIGVSDFITITPLVKYYFSPNNELSFGTVDTTIKETANSDIKQLYAGIRIGFRFDDR